MVIQPVKNEPEDDTGSTGVSDIGVDNDLGLIAVVAVAGTIVVITLTVEL